MADWLANHSFEHLIPFIFAVFYIWLNSQRTLNVRLYSLELQGQQKSKADGFASVFREAKNNFKKAQEKEEEAQTASLNINFPECHSNGVNSISRPLSPGNSGACTVAISPMTTISSYHKSPDMPGKNVFYPMVTEFFFYSNLSSFLSSWFFLFNPSLSASLPPSVP